MGKRFAAVGMATAIGLGGLGVAAVNPLQAAGAKSASATTEAPATGTAKAGPLKRALDKLVADGTLTQAQADKVLAATKSEAEAGRAQHKEKRQANRQELLGVVAKAIGSTPDDVTAGLKAGTSIAEQAKAKGVDRQVVKDAVTKALTARIDAAVSGGKLPAERATKLKARVPAMADRILDADGHRLGQGAGRGGHRRGGN